MTPLQLILPLFESAPTTENWKIVKDFPDYAVSDSGKVKRLTNKARGKAGRILKTPLRHGYPCVTLCNDKGRKNYLVHRLVALAFLRPIAGKPYVNHINIVRTDSNVSNLEWVSQSENCEHAYRIGLRDSSGERSGRAQLNWEKVEEIRKIAKDSPSLSHSKIGIMFNIGRDAIRRVISRKNWITKQERELIIQKNGKRLRNKSHRNYSTVNRPSPDANGETTHELLARKLDYYGHRCYYCKIELKGRDLTFDHAIPAKRGGTNWTANLLPCCQRCNSSKGNRTIFEFMDILKKNGLLASGCD